MSIADDRVIVTQISAGLDGEFRIQWVEIFIIGRLHAMCLSLLNSIMDAIERGSRAMHRAGIFRFFGARMEMFGVVLSIGLGCASAHAATQIGMLNQPYPYLVIEQDLRIVLSEFGRNLGIETKVSRNVGGMVRGLRNVDSADAFLRSLTDAHDLVWYMDRNTLFVSTRKENSTELLPVPSMKVEQRQALASEWSRQGAGISIVLDDRSPALFVTGPTSFRERIAAVVNSERVASSPGVHSRDIAEITVYRGKAGRQRVMVSR